MRQQLKPIKAIKADFQFPHYESTETLSCHGNKNNVFVEANPMNISENF